LRPTYLATFPKDMGYVEYEIFCPYELCINF